jgi:hypothetical protein
VRLWGDGHASLAKVSHCPTSFRHTPAHGTQIVGTLAVCPAADNMKRRPTPHSSVPAICLILVTGLFNVPLLGARARVSGTPQNGSAARAHKPTVKERILEIPPGTMVEAKLQNKQKIRGRLGEVTNEGFSLTSAQGNKIVTAFSEVKSVKKAGGKGDRIVGYVVLGVVAVVVIVIVGAVAGKWGGG